MSKINRRELLAGIGAAGMVGCAGPTETQSAGGMEPGGLNVPDYEPKSMLHVPESEVLEPKYPVIDIHSHLTWSDDATEELTVTMPPEEVLQVMDRKKLKLMANLTAGHGKALDEAIATFQTPHPDRFAMFVEPHFSKVSEPDYPQFQGEAIETAQKAGAKGLKILKSLGLVVRENGPDSPLLKIDDPRFDPMWEACAGLNLPVAIHSSDPEAFFLPIDRFNERWEELHAHPDWSFYGKDYPSDRELQEARRRIMKRHPKTNFLALHVANAENLEYTSECMDAHPNMTVELGARIGELGRQPKNSRKFFDKYQDRILFGTDAVPHGDEYPQQVFVDKLYEIYYRFLETEDEYFDYAPAAVPPQGRWRIYGLGLPDSILKKVYYDNAARLLGLPALA